MEETVIVAMTDLAAIAYQHHRVIKRTFGARH